MKKKLSVLLALVLCLGLTACGPKEADPTAVPTATPAADGKRTVTDTTGRTFEVPEVVERVVVLTAGECEIVYALGAGDLVVGRGEYCNYPEEALEVTAVQSGSDTNMEQILALEPQVVFMSDMDQSPEQVAALENAGIAVCMSKNTDIENVYATIKVVGEVLGREAEAEAMVADMQERFDAVREKSAGHEEATVYFEVSPLQYGLWTSGADTFMNEIAEMLGLTNAFADVSGWAEISEEQVLERDPDYIVTIQMYFGEGATPVEEILSRPGWEGLKAISGGKVYNANSDQISRPGPRLADAAEMLYEFVYGE